MFAPGEQVHLLSLMQAVHPKIVLEIGCHAGRTSALILRDIPSIEKYMGIDVKSSYRMGFSAQQQELLPEWKIGIDAKADPRFILLLSANGSLDHSPSSIGPVDAVFIDGDHSYRVVKHDSELARQVVRPGGIIIWHDYDVPSVDVTKVLNEDIQAGHCIKKVDGTHLAYEMR